MHAKDVAKQKDIYKTQEPKVLYFDLETSPILGWSWTTRESDVLKVEQDTMIICMAWKWEHESRIHVKALPDYKGYKAGATNMDDSQLIAELWGLLDDADVVVAQNGDKFDVRVANARFVYHDIFPPSPFIQLDTVKIARKYFKLPSYKLDEILRYLNLPRKMSTGGLGLWFDCMDGKATAWNKMKQYNKNDVALLPPVYKKLRGYHKNHPNLSFFTRVYRECPTCLSDQVIKRGTRKHERTGVRQEYNCKDCGHWFSGPILRDGIDKVVSY